MGKHAQLIIGPAGSGKTTYCAKLYEYCCASKRTVHIINLDPAAEDENFPYPVSIDIRELISIDDVMHLSDEAPNSDLSLNLGPNGGLIFCMEYLLENISWLEDKINGEGSYEDDYLIIDCPGQIELYTHLPVMRTLVTYFTEQWNYRMCCVFLLDSTFITDTSKFLSGILCCLSTMIQLELPHVNILTKIDLLTKNKSRKNENTNHNESESESEPDDTQFIDQLCNPDLQSLVYNLKQKNENNKNMKQSKMEMTHDSLTSAICELLMSYSMVSFLPYSSSDSDSIGLCLANIDRAIQYGEDKEPTDPTKWEEIAQERMQKQ